MILLYGENNSNLINKVHTLKFADENLDEAKEAVKELNNRPTHWTFYLMDEKGEIINETV